MRREDAVRFKDKLVEIVNAVAESEDQAANNPVTPAPRSSRGKSSASAISVGSVSTEKDAIAKRAPFNASDVLASAVREQGNGPDDIRPWLARLSARARMVCSIAASHHTLRGTGFLIGPDLVLTCFHVIRDAFKSPALAGDLEITFDREARADSTGHDTGVTYQLVENGWLGSHSEEAGLDFAVLMIEGRPGDDRRGGAVRGWINLGDADAGKDNDFVASIHHPDDARLLVSFGSIAAAATDEAETHLNHTARSFPGSSGSPILSFFGKLVGMHVGLPQGGPPNDPVSRLALRASALQAAIKENPPRSPVD
jgi:V8-like Glu-specific endopeptidase